MDISVKPELERFIDERVRAGAYSSPSEVIEAGLARLMLDPDALDDEDLAAIEESEAEISRGEDLDWKTASSDLRRTFLGE